MSIGVSQAMVLLQIIEHSNGSTVKTGIGVNRPSVSSIQKIPGWFWNSPADLA